MGNFSYVYQAQRAKNMKAIRNTVKEHQPISIEKLSALLVVGEPYIPKSKVKDTINDMLTAGVFKTNEDGKICLS